jgi:long-chain acyl-CoA synthetase
MSFWKLDHPADRLAVIDVATGRRKTYADIRSDVSKMLGAFPERKGPQLVLLLARNRYECLVAYLAALNAGHPLILVDASTPRDLLNRLVQTYVPDLILSTSELALPGYSSFKWDGMNALRADVSRETAIHSSLALLLNTSGSTGSPKLVRLSHGNLQSNAESIHQYLQLTSAERPITSLPMPYSYGLSVINSHLVAGGTLVLAEYGVLQREFWDCIDHHACTSFAGVPYTYQMLLQTGLLLKRGASLRTLTQAGGALAPDLVRKMRDLALERRFKFFVMYGQTEATARIAFVPFEQLESKIGSIGKAIPGGELQLDPTTSELLYTGPNVMMGYSESRDDLARGDESKGMLRTGDLARQDADGFFYITGRLKRFLKIFGKRFNLDEIEQILQERCRLPLACFGQDDHLIVAVETEGDVTGMVAKVVREMFALPSSAVHIRTVPRLPRTARDKTDYSALQNLELSADGAAHTAALAGGSSPA